MAGTLIEITTDMDEVQATLAEFLHRFDHTLPAMEIIGETLSASVRRNFEKGGRPESWEALSPVTLALKDGQGSTLVGRGGAASGLLGSIHYQAEDSAVYVGTDKIYAATHQFGRDGGGWGGADSPARPFLMIQNEDVPEMVEALKDYIMTGAQ